MNIRNLDLNLLHVFITVYDCKSITIAAKQLHLSQPAVSNAITRLNHTLGMVLFVKNSRFIAPTRQADALYLDIKCCLQKITSTLSQQIHFDPETSERTFRVAISNYGEIGLFSKLIPHLLNVAPNIKLVHEICPAESFCQYLQNGQLDIGLFFDRPVEKDIQKEFLYSDSLVLITGPQHPPLLDNLAIDDIVKLDFISLENEFNNLDFSFSEFYNHPKYCDPRFTVATMWSMFFIVSITTLVAVSPLSYAKKLEKHLPIKVHTLTDVEEIELNLYWRNVETEDPGHKWLRQVIKEMFTNNSW